MHDLIVAGAGCAGCVAAERAAARGFRVLLVERSPAQSLGHPWVNGVERAVFEETGIPFPSGDETMPSPERSRFLSPSGAHYVEIASQPTVEVRMSHFARRLLAGALQAGAELRDETTVAAPLVEKGRVRGVVTEAGKELPARVVLDASGWEAAIRRGLPEESPIPREVDPGCLVTAWREQRRFAADEAQDVPVTLEIPPDVSLSRVGWRGGYSVLMLHWDSAERELDILAGFRASQEGETAGEFVERFLREKGLGGERVYGGGGLIPVRLSLDVLVDHGVLLAGDAACMVVPTHGSGVASALIAGGLAALTVSRCLRENDTSRQNLWEYACAYQRGRGSLTAYFDVTQAITDRFAPKEMEKLVGCLMTPGDVEAGLRVRPLSFRLAELPLRLRALRHPLFSARFAWMASAAMKLRKIYRGYPARYDAAALREWQQAVERARKRLLT